MNELFQLKPFSLTYRRKNALFSKTIKFLNQHHYENCKGYSSILDVFGYKQINSNKIEELPFIHVNVFKNNNLYSIEKKRILKTVESSGTSGKEVSKIFLDKENAKSQSIVLKSIVSDFIGNNRLPMLIVDSELELKNRFIHSARAAGIIGFSIFGKNKYFALNKKMELEKKVVTQFFNKYKNKEILIFGFSYIVWNNFIKQVLKTRYNLPKVKGTLIHGGGWKKLNNEKVSNTIFKKTIQNVCGVNKIINYYGMVEQTGSIFLECENGFFHTSNFSDIFIRNKNYSLCDFNESGLVQLISLLPKSYPGHNILTDDIGEVMGIDDCKCGRKGKYFLVHGRIKKAELRGCSDTT